LRSTYHFLAIVLLGLAAIALVFSIVQVRPTRLAPLPQRVVFVDLTRLSALHPSFAVLTKMKAFAAEAGRRPGPTRPPVCPPAPALSAVRGPVEPAEVTRPEIEAETAQSAVSAFSRLETEQRQALQARLRAVRATMLESAKPEVAAKIREIERAAEFKQRSLVTQLGDMRLTTLIRADALRSIVTGFNSILPQDVSEDERDPDGVLAGEGAKLKATELELQKIDKTLNSESIAIRAEAQEKISKLRADAAAEVAAKLSARENAERTRIETGIAAARNEVLSELGTSEGASGFDQAEPRAGARSVPVVTIMPSSRPPSKAGPSGYAAAKKPVLSAVEGMAASLEARIRSDVVRAVRELASRSGLKVTFSPTENAPDATSAFALLLRESGSQVWGPVLAAGGG